MERCLNNVFWSQGVFIWKFRYWILKVDVNSPASVSSYNNIKGPWIVPWGTPSLLHCPRTCGETFKHDTACSFSCSSAVKSDRNMSRRLHVRENTCFCVRVTQQSVTLRLTSTLKHNPHSGTGYRGLKALMWPTIIFHDFIVNKLQCGSMKYLKSYCIIVLMD